MKEEFNEYMIYFKGLPLKEKQGIVIDQLKMIASLTNKMCEQLKVPNEVIVNKELKDLLDENYTQDDFAEAVITLVNSIQNSICDFDIKLNEITENME